MATEQAKQEGVVIPGYLKFSKILVWVIYFWVILGIVSLALRVFLLAASASQAAGFVDFVYRVSGDYLQPFRGIWPPKSVGETGYLDIAAIFAIIVYMFLAWGLHSLIDYVQNRIDRTRAQQEAELKKAELAKRQAAQRKAAPAKRAN